ncbi:hypothetical protein EII17_07785 [Clostridiales bacterium COT073_COT-073]|nr:hypothetical protein EII17_07785 [Clostridiales bacterium COT073_COT-073]
MMKTEQLPPVIKNFIDSKIVCMEFPLLPCIYGDFEKMQMGYRWDPIQQLSLIADKPGAWQENWYVIAQNGLGDPFFVDIKAADYPVYTAMHGTGKWKAIKVAESIEQFSEILKKINQTDWNLACDLGFLEGIINLENEFWLEVNESCQEE